MSDLTNLIAMVAILIPLAMALYWAVVCYHDDSAYMMQLDELSDGEEPWDECFLEN